MVFIIITVLITNDLIKSFFWLIVVNWEIIIIVIIIHIIKIIERVVEKWRN